MLQSSKLTVQRIKKNRRLAIAAKKRHTYKSLVISRSNRRIEYLSGVVNGSIHDYKLLQNEFEPSLNWFENFEVELDLGFQGFVKDYAYEKVFIPHKRKRTKKGEPKQELTKSQRSQNKQMASTRIRVEHSI